MLTHSQTKLMDTTVFREALQRGTWSITYDQRFVKAKTTSRTPPKPIAVAALRGTEVATTSPILSILRRFDGKPGWHSEGGFELQVAKNAQSFRTPEPRFSAAAFPLRSSYGRFLLDGGPSGWRRLEHKTASTDLADQHGRLFSRTGLGDFLLAAGISVTPSGTPIL
jgi:hypothetical protein